jgi:hypothetical protein
VDIFEIPIRKFIVSLGVSGLLVVNAKIPFCNIPQATPMAAKGVTIAGTMRRAAA